MKVGTTHFPKKTSSFYSVEKDLKLIIERIMTSEPLLKMLYYPDNSCLNKPSLTAQQKLSLIGTHIKLIPTFLLDEGCPNYIVVYMDQFQPNPSNPEFRDNVIRIPIICHTKGWSLGDFKLRPLAIASEIDGLLNEQKFTGIGTLQLMSCKRLLLNPELIGYELIYAAIHGDDDKLPPNNVF